MRWFLYYDGKAARLFGYGFESFETKGLAEERISELQKTYKDARLTYFLVEGSIVSESERDQ